MAVVTRLFQPVVISFLSCFHNPVARMNGKIVSLKAEPSFPLSWFLSLSHMHHGLATKHKNKNAETASIKLASVV